MAEPDVVEDFELPDAAGTPVRLSRLLADGPVVLFFYPAAMSPGCTREACHFRDVAAELAALGARAVGISMDPPEGQRRFDERHGLGFPLLSDEAGTVARALGVKRRFGPLSVRRVTFVIGTDRRILGSVHDEVRMGRHADEAMAILRAAQGGTAGGAAG